MRPGALGSILLWLRSPAFFLYYLSAVNGKPGESRGHKATGLRDSSYDSGAAGALSSSVSSMSLRPAIEFVCDKGDVYNDERAESHAAV